MPGMDGTGPFGTGPQGRRRGRCSQNATVFPEGKDSQQQTTRNQDEGVNRSSQSSQNNPPYGRRMRQQGKF